MSLEPISSQDKTFVRLAKPNDRGASSSSIVPRNRKILSPATQQAKKEDINFIKISADSSSMLNSL